MPEERKPDYVDKTIRLASAFFDAEQDLEAGKLLRLVSELDHVSYMAIFNVLAKEYTPKRVEYAEKKAIEDEIRRCERAEDGTLIKK